MSQANLRGKDRRKRLRYKQAIHGWCEVGGIRFEARTYDISEEGMTLFTLPTLPDVKQYTVHCRLENGLECDFPVEERTRRTLRRKNLHFLRLGVEITNRNLDMIVFFRELAEIQAKAGAFATTTSQDDGRGRLDFQLPVVASLAGKTWRCQTLDMGSWGLSVLAPQGFPKAETCVLTCIDPEGNDIKIVAQERNRAATEDGVRIGFLVIEGNRSFRGFVEKYAQW